LHVDGPICGLPRPPGPEELADFLSILAVPIRLRIALILANGERHVNALAGELKVAQPTISHHLGLMRSVGFVETRRAGRQVFYRLRDPQSGGNGLTLDAPGCRVRFTVGATAGA
jgi:DNA-binding transcriptional ArsR family regulator